MKKIILCVFVLPVSVNAFADEAEIRQLTVKAEYGDAEAQQMAAEWLESHP